MENLHYENIANKDYADYYFTFKKEDDNFKKLWQLKSAIRESIKEWLFTGLDNLDLTDTIANACSELIENCIKYSLNDTISALYIRLTDTMIVIETLNLCLPEDKAYVTNFITDVNSGKIIPGELYVDRLVTSSHKEKSMLGLLTILLEINGKLEYVDTPGHDEALHVKVLIDID